jgi:uncharacterized protein DUF4375
MTDKQWSEAILEFVHREVAIDFQDWPTAVMRLPRCVRVYYVTWNLEAEVCNGGFIHYFLNFWGRLGEEAVSCYEELGCPALGEVVRRAADIFWGMVNTGRFVEKESYEVECAIGPELEPLDSEFYALGAKHDPDRLRSKYVRKHKAEFAALIARGEEGEAKG